MGAFLFRRRIQLVAIAWVALALFGWAFYLPFMDGQIDGFYRFARIYGSLGMVSSILLLLSPTIVLPLFGVLVLSLIAGAFLQENLKTFTRQLAKFLSISILIVLMLLIATIPSAITGNFLMDSETIAAWEQSFHSVYIAPAFDSNYGDEMLLRCNRFGLCHQIYRAEGQAVPHPFPALSERYPQSERADTIVYDSDRELVGFFKPDTSEWVYVGDRNGELCNAGIGGTSAECQFDADR